jgi:hypothetical protein
MAGMHPRLEPSEHAARAVPAPSSQRHTLAIPLQGPCQPSACTAKRHAACPVVSVSTLTPSQRHATDPAETIERRFHRARQEKGQHLAINQEKQDVRAACRSEEVYGQIVASLAI